MWRMHLCVEGRVGDKDLNFFGGTRVTEAIAQLRWERTWQKDDSFDILSWPVFGRVDREEEGDSFDLFFQVLTESHAKKMEPEVKQLFSCVRSESNRRFFKFSISPQLSPVVREFQSWQKLMDSFPRTRWWQSLFRETFAVLQKPLLLDRWWGSSWNTRARGSSGGRSLSYANRYDRCVISLNLDILLFYDFSVRDLHKHVGRG